ncbi:hypothetical protein GCM10027421_13210 [Microbacterium shaanxiense]
MRDVAPPSDPADEPGFLIVVIRTGGIAGIRRRWRVVPPHDEEPHWIELIDSCPWDDPSADPQRGADRYVWSIQARTPRARLERELPESALDGPWRQLVDAVREAGNE